MAMPKNLESRLKEGTHPIIHLAKGEKALYLGSGPDLGSARHIAGIVDSPHYVLSDLEFEAEQAVQFKDCKVTCTPRDAFELLKEGQYRFVMIDNALLGRFLEAYKNVKEGAYVYIHATFAADSQFSKPCFYERLGMEKVSGMLFRKARKPSDEDVNIAETVSGAGEMLSGALCMANAVPNEGAQHVFDSYGRIIEKDYVLSIADSLRQAADYLAPRANKKEMSFLRQGLRDAYAHIAPMKNPFYAELHEALKYCVRRLGG